MALTEFHEGLTKELDSLLTGEGDWLANTANTTALLFTKLPEVNWVGVYFMRPSENGEQLVVGPFQGKPACTRIRLGRGVCGTAAERRETIVVPDVHEFPGHIACDCASMSEIVIPILDGDRLIGVLDIDSPVRERFATTDQEGLEAVVATLVRHTTFPETIF